MAARRQTPQNNRGNNQQRNAPVNNRVQNQNRNNQNQNQNQNFNNGGGQDYDNERHGALFSNNKRTQNSPDYTGTCTIDGVEYFQSAWVKVSKTGQRYLSQSFTPTSELQNGGGNNFNANNQQGTDDLPF